MRHIVEFLRTDDAATAVEYAVMLALIVGTCIVAIQALGNGSSGMWGNNKSQLDAVGFSGP